MRNKALEAGTVSLSDAESQKILRVQMETSKPHPPILAFATEYLKVNERAQAKLRKVNIETREEKLIPKPKAPQSGESSKKRSNKQSPEQLLESDEEDEEAFRTKLDDVPEDEEEEAPKPAKKMKQKRKIVETVNVTKKKSKKKKNHQPEFEAQDELVDLDLSD